MNDIDLLEYEAVKNLAYRISESKGHAPGHERENWLQAEQEIRIAKSQQSQLGRPMNGRRESQRIGSQTDNLPVLLSWSGKLSREVALVWRECLERLLPGTQAWMSEKDIPKGKEWYTKLSEELKCRSVCIVCVTKENTEAQGASSWLFYEVGAIASSLDSVLVCPYLLGLSPSDLKGSPLSHFQCTLAEKDDTLQLILTLNEMMGHRHHHDLVESSFLAQWPQFEQRIMKARGLS